MNPVTFTHPLHIAHSKHIAVTSESFCYVTYPASRTDVESRRLVLCHPHVEEGMEVADCNVLL